MQSKWWSGLVVAVALFWPAAASAQCDFYGAYGPGPTGIITSRFALSGSLHVIPGEGEEDTHMVPAASLRIAVGERVVLAPALGYCTGGEEGELVLGGTAQVALISTDQWSLAVQSHIARVSYEFGSVMAIPVLAAATFDVSETARLYANFGLRFLRSSPEDGDAETESDPAASIGIALPVGSLGVTGGIVLVNPDDGGTDFSFGGRVTFPLGG